MATVDPEKFVVKAGRGVSVWTDGEPVFEFTGTGKNAALWVGIDTGPAWFWMTAAQARHFAHFLNEHLGGDES